MASDLIGDNYRYDPTYHRFADLMGVDKYKRDSIDIAKKLSLLYEWGEEQVGKNDFIGIAKAVNQLQKSIGVNALGKTLVDTLYQWVRLDQDGKEAKQAIQKEFERAVDWEKRKVVIKEIGKDWKREQITMKKKIEREQNSSAKNLEKTIDQYKKSIPKERIERIKEIPLLDSKPISQAL